VVKDYQGKLLNGPNDVWVRPDGGLYFTDPFYKRSYWKRGPKEQAVEGVYYLSPDRQKLVRVVEDLKQPNGIIGTPDGKVLYVADIGASRTYAYAIRPDGTLANKRLFCKLGSDGMTLDDQGNVYLTGKGIAYLYPETEQRTESPVLPRFTDRSAGDMRAYFSDPPFVPPPAERIRLWNYWLMSRRLATPTFLLTATGFGLLIRGSGASAPVGGVYQDGDRARRYPIDHNQIGIAIAIEVAGGDEGSIAYTSRETLGALKGAIAVAEQDV
jgi:SMP-30/Gluconolactonase/LRE-like region